VEVNEQPAFTGQKRCPNCGQWSGHYQRPDDRCEHCGELLDPQASAKEEALEKAWNWELNKTVLIPISPNDPWLLRMLKYLVRGGQLLFAATVAFILWFLTAVAG
jgi:predicted amidophosphoribosyltransferase